LPSLLYLLLNSTPTTHISTLSLHDALPIFQRLQFAPHRLPGVGRQQPRQPLGRGVGPVRRRKGVVDVEVAQLGELRREGRVVLLDRKSTRLNSSHVKISYAVFCLKKKNTSR